MKKLIFHCLYFVVAICALTACNKNSEEDMTSAVPDKPVVSQTESKILAFIQQMNSPLKSGEEYTTDSTIWYLEATLNYTYCTYDSSMLFLSRDTSTCNIDLNENGKVDETDLGDAYAKMLDSLEYHYDNSLTNYKHPFYCDVSELSNGNGILELQLVTVIACGYNPVQYAPFGEEDYWHSVLDEGKCDPFEGDGDGEDAGDKIAYKIMHPLIVPNPQYRVCWDDLNTEENIMPYDYPYQYAPRGYRAFYYAGSGAYYGSQCCDPDELNFYISNNGIDYIIDDLQPSGKEFHSIFIQGELLWIDWDHWEELHLMNITYGVKYLTLTPASEL